MRKRGSCFDQVLFENYCFDKLKIPHKIYFIYKVGRDGYFLANNSSLHVFLVFYVDDKVYWFENAWATNRGIHEFNDDESLLENVIKRFKDKSKTTIIIKKDCKIEAGQTPWDCIISNIDEINIPEKIYHISPKKITGKMTARIPTSDFENQLTPRICFAKTIQGALIGANENDNLIGKKFYVYSQPGKLGYYTPTKKEVQDADITGEVWLCAGGGSLIPDFEFMIEITGISKYTTATINNKKFNIPIWDYKKIRNP